MDLRSLQTFGSRFPERINQIIFVRLPQLGVRAVKPDSGQRQSGFLLAEGDHVASENSVSRASSFYRRRSEEHTSELQSRLHLVCRLLLEKKKIINRGLALVVHIGHTLC